ncbi:MAG: hypothetical protein EPO20_12110 [Betaproteobacteria bacterium]|nr:MAG: hypothetical protein EPO20_12110 [Betaproteobacteria bacterium]
MNFAFLKTDLSKRAALAVLALLLVAGIVAGREKPSLSVPEKVNRIEARVELADDIDLSKLERPAAAQAPHNDPFARRSFAPPAPQVAAAEPPKPVAPPLPFRYMGRLTQDGKTEVFLLRGEEILSIAAGRKIDAQYRVDAVTDSAIRITYLPLRTRQSLELAQ